MIVDFHTHIFPPQHRDARERLMEADGWFAQLYSNPRAKMATADDLIRSMDRAGVDLSVVMGFAWNDAGLCRECNDYLQDSTRRHPGRLVALASVQPLEGAGAVYELERRAAAGFRGVGEMMPDGQGYDLSDERTAGQVLAAVEQFGLLALTHASEPVGHAYAGKGTVRPDVIYAVARRYPRLNLVCAHWGGGLPFYELMPEVAQSMTNVRYDTAASTLLYDTRIFSIARSLLPAHKVLFGTDYPVLGQRRSLERIRALGLPPEHEAALCGENALDLLAGIPAGGGPGTVSQRKAEG